MSLAFLMAFSPLLGIAVGLTILFVAFKLTDVIQWSWIRVSSPIWITFLLLIILFVILLTLGAN